MLYGVLIQLYAPADARFSSIYDIIISNTKYGKRWRFDDILLHADSTKLHPIVIPLKDVLPSYIPFGIFFFSFFTLDAWHILSLFLFASLLYCTSCAYMAACCSHTGLSIVINGSWKKKRVKIFARSIMRARVRDSWLHECILYWNFFVINNNELTPMSFFFLLCNVSLIKTRVWSVSMLYNIYVVRAVIYIYSIILYIRSDFCTRIHTIVTKRWGIFGVRA